MQTNVTIDDVARLAKVSVSTVSRVLNDHPDVSGKTRQRVLDVIEQQGYVPNNSARNLKRQRMHAVGVVVKGFTNPFFTPMLETMQAELTRRRYITLLHPVHTSEDELDSAISLVKEKKPKGLIFLGGNFQHSREKSALLDVPYVMATITMHRGVDRRTFSSITVDDYAEGYNVGRRVCGAGHRQIALIGYTPEDRSISNLRFAGFTQAVADSCGSSEALVYDYAGQFTMQGGYEAAKRLLAHHRFTCLFCISDIIAIGAMRAIHEARLSIPGDISVIGFDGVPAARYAIPSLATMRQPSANMAKQSVRMLLAQLEYGEPPRHEILPADFIEGESFCPLGAPQPG